MTYDPLTYFLGALAATLLVGSFCFGLVGLLRQPWRSALRRAAALVGICFTVFGLVFPAFVVSDNLPSAKILSDLGRASTFSAAAGGLAIPLALEAPVSLKQWESSPWLSYHAKSSATAVHWRTLALSTAMSHPEDRLFQHAARLGVVGSLVGGAISVAVLGALVLLSIGLCRSAGARSLRRGLSLGILQGGAIACLLAVVAWLSSYHLSLNGDATYWGPTVLGAIQTVVTLIVVCGLTGLLYGARQARRESRVTTAT